MSPSGLTRRWLVPNTNKSDKPHGTLFFVFSVLKISRVLPLPMDVPPLAFLGSLETSQSLVSPPTTVIGASSFADASNCTIPTFSPSSTIVPKKLLQPCKWHETKRFSHYWPFVWGIIKVIQSLRHDISYLVLLLNFLVIIHTSGNV